MSALMGSGIDHRCLMLDVCGGASVVIICDQERALDISD